LWLIFEVLAFSFLGYISVSLILTLIALFGATEAELVKYLRRTLTIVNSFVLFRKQLTAWHVIGFAAVLLSYTMTFRSKGRQDAPTAALSSTATLLIVKDGE
jgi:adenosine 3'-phospho 5'-phosphosulfate transporter B3